MVDEWTERRIANRGTSAISLVNASPQRQKHEKPRRTITGASSDLERRKLDLGVKHGVGPSVTNEVRVVLHKREQRRRLTKRT
jgi:hypothetical protein